MKGLQNVLGPIGLALILIGGVTYGILYTSGWIALLPLLTGLGLTVVSIALNQRATGTESSIRSARFGFHAGISIVFLAAILIFLQTLSARHSSRVDTTMNRRFSLSSQTEKILTGLSQEITFTCFFKETTPGKTELEDLLEEYQNINHLVSYQFINPDKNPIAARRYEIKSYGTVVVESGDMEEKILEITEEKLTNTILKVTREVKKVIYFISGHGERSIDDDDTSGFSAIKEAITVENYEVKELQTLREEKIPDDCEVLVIAGPEKDLFQAEHDMIAGYLTAGGKVLILLEPILDLPLLYSIATSYGIKIGNDLIIDRFGRVLAGNFLTPVVNQYGDHPITDGFRLPSFFPQTRSVTRIEDTSDDVTVGILASTGNSAYAETNIDAIIDEGKTQFEEESDIAGPIDIAIVATKEVEPSPMDEPTGLQKQNSSVVVFGDADFASNAYLNLSGNRDLVMNTINWLAEEEDLIAIRPKDTFMQPVILTARQGRIAFWLPVIGLPAIVGALGVAVAIHRRRSA